MNGLLRFLVIVLILFSKTAVAQQGTSRLKVDSQTKEKEAWKIYSHQGASVKLPSYFAYGMLTDSGIQYFDAAGLDDVMIAIEVWTGDEKDFKAQFDAAQQYLNSTGSYKLFKGNWYVVSGNQSETIHYDKAVIKGQTIHHLMIDYPENQKERMDIILSVISKSFH